MSTYRLLLSPRVLTYRGRLRKGDEGSLGRILLLGLVAAAFWAAIFWGAHKVLLYFLAAEGFGQILARKLMNMVWITFLAVLAFSNVITSLSTFFLSKDLETIHASPVPLETVFWARLTDTLVDSSWMVILFGLPVFLAYGLVFHAGPVYYLLMIATAVPFLVTASAIGTMATQVLVNVFPARRTKDILFLMGILLVIVLYLMFRIIRPERLVNPEAFSSALRYFASFSTPSSPYLPSHWATEALWPHLVQRPLDQSLFFLGLLWSTGAGMAVCASWVSDAIYRRGFSRAQEGARQRLGKGPLDRLIWLLGRPFPRNSRVLLAKDLKTFFRDNSQWSQLLLLLALIVIYLYNFSVLDLARSPMPTFYLTNLISFLNIGLAAFVTAALGVRFIFPAVSAEGFSYWIVRSSPLSLSRFLWTKYGIYAPPLLFVGEVLVILSNHLLDVTPFMMAISTITIFFTVLGLVSLGIGLGAVYPRFEAENLAAVATGFGGMVYMVISAIYVAVVVILEAWPVYIIFMSEHKGWDLTPRHMTLLGLCGLGVVVAHGLAIWLPIRMGKNRLLAREA